MTSSFDYVDGVNVNNYLDVKTSQADHQNVMHKKWSHFPNTSNKMQQFVFSRNES